ncbi:MAG TPA: MerR family transcriptional regulator [Longimicrobiales bacterium]|nr:MerR family transcriptional regulator [Longimicrobiales bacterium]
MMELFPWEESEQAASRAGTEPESAAAEPDGAVADAGRAMMEPDDAAGEPGEPTEPEPEAQPDGDPRELEDTEDAPPETAPAPAQRRPLTETQTPRHGDPLRPPARERPVARKEYYSIGEVSELVGLPAHVLRYWESQFTVLNPSKNRSGNRAYQRKEIRLILLVKHLLYEEKYTVEGAKAKLDQLRRGGTLPAHTGAALDAQALRLLRADLLELRQLIAAPL